MTTVLPEYGRASLTLARSDGTLTAARSMAIGEDREGESSAMRAYLARMRRAPRAMKLFVLYTLLVTTSIWCASASAKTS
jgi:hypothetical protein